MATNREHCYADESAKGTSQNAGEATPPFFGCSSSSPLLQYLRDRWANQSFFKSVFSRLSSYRNPPPPSLGCGESTVDVPPRRARILLSIIATRYALRLNPAGYVWRMSDLHELSIDCPTTYFSTLCNMFLCIICLSPVANV